jgi:hypothetical protein
MSAAVSSDAGAARVHRSQSTRQPSTRTHDSPSRHAPRPSDATAALGNVARRDFEQTNLAEAGSRRTASRDPERGANLPTRSDSLRNGPVRSERRHASADAPRVPNGTDPASQTQPVQRKRTSVQCSTGTWILGKTIGQGSMGKVKQARNQETGEQVSHSDYIDFI